MLYDLSLAVVDLYRHLDGNMRLQTMLDVARPDGLDSLAWDEETLPLARRWWGCKTVGYGPPFGTMSRQKH